MSRLNQWGFAPIIVIVLLLGGVVAGTYLVQQRTNLLPKAFDQPTSPQCKTGLKSFELLGECKAKKYKAISFTCMDGTSGKVEAEKKECRSAGYLKAKAGEICKKQQLCEDDFDGDGQTGACTIDAKQCPDGSWVGREGPKCEFALCVPQILNECDKSKPNYGCPQGQTCYPTGAPCGLGVGESCPKDYCQSIK